MVTTRHGDFTDDIWSDLAGRCASYIPNESYFDVRKEIFSEFQENIMRRSCSLLSKSVGEGSALIMIGYAHLDHVLGRQPVVRSHRVQEGARCIDLMVILLSTTSA